MFICDAAVMTAQTVIAKPDLSTPSLVAPGYFGPNAFPVPDMSDGSTSSEFKVELYGDWFMSTKGYGLTEDLTLDIFAKATIPLFTDRVNLVLWMPVVEKTLFHSILTTSGQTSLSPISHQFWEVLGKT